MRLGSTGARAPPQGLFSGAGPTQDTARKSLELKPVPFCADSVEAPKPKSPPEQPSGQGRTRAVTQVRVLGPEDDLASMVLQV